MQDVEEQMLANNGKINKASLRLGAMPKQDLKNFLDDGIAKADCIAFDTKPIADLFLSTTISKSSLSLMVPPKTKDFGVYVVNIMLTSTFCHLKLFLGIVIQNSAVVIVFGDIAGKCIWYWSENVTNWKYCISTFISITLIAIAGFTAWSSVREPTQVFILLETLYHAFDEIAKRRRVFKGTFTYPVSLAFIIVAKFYLH